MHSKTSPHLLSVSAFSSRLQAQRQSQRTRSLFMVGSETERKIIVSALYIKAGTMGRSHPMQATFAESFGVRQWPHNTSARVIQPKGGLGYFVFLPLLHIEAWRGTYVALGVCSCLHYSWTSAKVIMSSSCCPQTLRQSLLHSFLTRHLLTFPDKQV